MSEEEHSADDMSGPTAAEEWGFDTVEGDGADASAAPPEDAAWCFVDDDKAAEAEQLRRDASRCHDIRDMCRGTVSRRKRKAAPACGGRKRAKPSLRGVSAGEGAHSPLLRPPNEAVDDIPPPEPETRGRKLLDWLARTPKSRVVFVEEMPAGLPTRICMLRHEHAWLPEQLDYLLQFSGRRVACMDACGKTAERAFCCMWRNYLENLTTVDMETMLPSVDFDEEDDGPAVHVYLRFR